jgi:hypothetical protein
MQIEEWRDETIHNTVDSICIEKPIYFSDEIFTCGTCGKEFPKKKYLKRHQKLHNSNVIIS